MKQKKSPATADQKSSTTPDVVSEELVLLRNMLNQSLDVICTIDADGRFVNVSAAAFRCWGFLPEELQGRMYMDLVHPDDREMTASVAAAIMSGRSFTDFDNRYVRKDGSIVPITWSARWEDTERMMYCVARDATEKLNARKNLENSEILHRLLFDTSPLPKWIFDMETFQIIEVNNTAVNHYGFSREEFLAMTVKDLRPAKELPELLAAHSSLQKLQGVVRLGVFTHHKKDGTLIRMDVTGQQLMFRDKPCVMVACLDITMQELIDEVSKLESEVMEHCLREDSDLIGILHTYLSGLEGLQPGMSSSVLQVNNDCVFKLVAPSLPPDFMLQLEGQAIGPHAGSCGTAAYTGKRVIVNDIDTDPLWADYKHTAQHHGLRACWSLPIFNAKGKVVGTFANYYKTVRTPTTAELEIFERSAALLGIILESNSKSSELKKNEKLYRALVEQGADAIAIVGPDGNTRYVSPSISRVLGYSEEEAMKLNLFETIHPEDVDQVAKKMERALRRPGIPTRGHTARTLHKDGSWRWLEATITNMLHDPDINGIVDNFRDVTEAIEVQRRLDTASELAKVGAWEVDIRTDAHYWSPMTRQIHEVPEDFVPDMNAAVAFYREDVRAEVVKAVSMAIASGESFNYEVPIITALGNQRWVRVIGTAVFENGACIKINGSFQDIQQLKDAEEATIEAYKQTERILESISDGFFAVDENWIVAYWNKEAEGILGTKREDILGKNLWDVFKDAVGLDFYFKYHKAMNTKQVVVFEDFYPTLNKLFEVTAYPGENGISVYFKDITIRRQAEEQVRQTNERYEKVAEATQDAIWDWDLVNDTIRWSEGFYRLFGHAMTPEDSSPAIWTSNIHVDDMREVIDSMNLAISDATQQRWKAEYRYKKADGSYASVVDRGTVIRSNSGEAVRMVGAMTDITQHLEHQEELKKINTELERSNSDLEQFAHIASHDLQEPLRMVTSFLDQLRKKYDGQLDERAQQYIQFAYGGALRMRQTILDLLQYSRVGRLDQQLELVDTNEMLQQTTELLRDTIATYEAQVTWSNLPKVMAARTLLQQVFQNLISNAMVYHRPGISPAVHITASTRSGFHHFKIVDNGTGIESRYFEKIFLMFQQLQVRDENSGSGIGLSICKKVIERHGGKIWVESALGKGSTFHFTLAVAPDRINR